jgi:hypothetical protein
MYLELGKATLDLVLKQGAPSVSEIKYYFKVYKKDSDTNVEFGIYGLPTTVCFSDTMENVKHYVEDLEEMKDARRLQMAGGMPPGATVTTSGNSEIIHYPIPPEEQFSLTDGDTDYDVTAVDMTLTVDPATSALVSAKAVVTGSVPAFQFIEEVHFTNFKTPLAKLDDIVETADFCNGYTTIWLGVGTLNSALSVMTRKLGAVDDDVSMILARQTLKGLHTAQEMLEAYRTAKEQMALRALVIYATAEVLLLLVAAIAHVFRLGKGGVHAARCKDNLVVEEGVPSESAE